MNLRRGLGAVVVSGLVITACTTWNKHASHESEPARDVASLAPTKNWGTQGAQAFSSNTLAALSSSGPMSMRDDAQLIVDNNAAFQKKLEIIRGAKDTLRLVYYIYADDFSSSVFSSELIAAAGRGVKVRLLVDFITNYERMDLFAYLVNAGRGNIEVRFYGFPGPQVLEGAVYMTYPCQTKVPEKGTEEAMDRAEEQCQNEKMANWKQSGSPYTTFFSKMYLAGLYGKNPTPLMASVQIGGQMDINSMKGAGPSTPEQKKKLVEFSKLLVKAKMSNDLASKFKLAMALQMYGDTLRPIMNQITGRLPLVLNGGQQYNHLTDYTHHKLIVADGQVFQLGGRNVEDSYHTDDVKKAIAEATPKYTFMDSDFYARSPEARQVEAAYDKLFGMPYVSNAIGKVYELIPNDYDVNSEPLKMALGQCLQDPNVQATGDALETCVNASMPKMPGYRSYEDRLKDVQAKMAKNAATYAANYSKLQTNNSWKAFDQQRSAANDQLAPEDRQTGTAYYLENLHYNKADGSQRRLFGSEIGHEADYGKYIHAAWLKGLENVCATSAQGNVRKRVVLHQAYFLAPSNLTSVLGNMTNGVWDCHNVDIVILTNSIESTDLNVINVIARYQLNALIANQVRTPAGRKASLKYFEYLPAKETVGNFTKKNKPAGVSLHTKISVLGDDMIIGSANADVRSYFMDTNNAVYLRNVPNTIRDYNAYIDRITADRTKTVEMTQMFANVSPQTLASQNEAIFKAMLSYYGRDFSAAKSAGLLFRVNSMGKVVMDTTNEIINAPMNLVNQSASQANYNDAAVGQQTNKAVRTDAVMDAKANGFDEKWKPL